MDPCGDLKLDSPPVTGDRRQGALQGPMRAASGHLRVRFQEIIRKHRGESGDQREDDLRGVLRDFLPRRLEIDHGEVVSAFGETSPAHDLIIYDGLDTHVLDRTKDSVIVPIEGVYAVIEVSSKLDGTKLRADADKIRTLKQMQRSEDAYFKQDEPVIETGFNVHGRKTEHFPTLGFCFGYDSSALPGLTEDLCALDDKAPIHERVDMVVSLSAGCIANVGANGKWTGTPTPDTHRIALPFDADAAPGEAFMLFYLLMSGPLAQARTLPISLVPYV